jgi:hypothetical protein
MSQDPKAQEPEESAVDLQKALTEEEVAPVSLSEKEQSRAAEGYSGHTNNPTMHVKVYSPFRNYFDDRAFSISAVNATGAFDILPRHHNFISLLNPCELIVRNIQSTEQKIRISGGLMHVKADQVIVFLDV